MTIFEQIFPRYVPLTQRLLQNFEKLIRDSIKNNSLFGNTIIISRVVESNTKNTFTARRETLQQAIDEEIRPLLIPDLSITNNSLENGPKRGRFS